MLRMNVTDTVYCNIVAILAKANIISVQVENIENPALVTKRLSVL